jgi:hypothetical protein
VAAPACRDWPGNQHPDNIGGCHMNIKQIKAVADDYTTNSRWARTDDDLVLRVIGVGRTHVRLMYPDGRIINTPAARVQAVW